MVFHKEIEQIHIYRRDYGATPNLNASDASFAKFRYYIHETGSGRPLKLGGKDVVLFGPDEYEIVKGEGSENGLKEIWTTGTILDGNSSGRFFRDYLTERATEDGLGALYKVSGIGDDKFNYRYFTGPRRAGATKGKYFQGAPVSQLENPDIQSMTPIENFYDLAGSFGNCRYEGGVEFRSGKKPQKLLETIIRHFSNPGDWALDSFAGSGTTGAIAQKMRRKWVMVELRDHCDTHIVPRMTVVIDGKDSTGVTENVGWRGGGGFRYYCIAPSLLERDKFGNWVISRQFNAAMLAEAMCKLEGSTYAPSESEYWMHGHSTEQDFIYVTTQTLNREQLQKLSEDVGENRSLLVCCSAFRARDLSQFPSLTVKKIPKMVVNRCEWGKDDYSLEIRSVARRHHEARPTSSHAVG